jgi:predicted nucleic acid-binding protein
MIVLDASAVLEVLLQLDAADALMDRLFVSGESLHAPQLLDVEVAQVLRRYARAGDITPARGAEALRDLADLPVERYPHTPLLDRIWLLRNNVTAYDAAYLALAEALDAALVTRDRSLINVPGVKVAVEVF